MTHISIDANRIELVCANLLIKPKNMLPRDAICQYTGWDYDESADYRYKYGLTGIPVYSTADGFICCTSVQDHQPNTNGIFDDSLWKRATGEVADYAVGNGRQIWILMQN